MSDTNTISLTYSKDLQPLVDTAINDFRQYLKDKAQNDMLVEQAKIKANKEKFDAALKMLNKNGAVDKLMLQAANKLMGQPDNVVQKVKKSIDDTVSKNNDDDLVLELKELIRKSPLKTYCQFLRDSIHSDKNVVRSIAALMISVPALGSLIDKLVNSSTEDEAICNLNAVKNFITPGDIVILEKVKSMLTSGEQRIVSEIVNFEG
jgi:hypothetical protein